MVFRGFGHIHAAQHPANLFDFLPLIDFFHQGGGPAVGHLFADTQMPAAETGNLRQMCDTNHLMMGRQGFQFASDDLRRGAADARDPGWAEA